jgi:hypothetical protein
MSLLKPDANLIKVVIAKIVLIDIHKKIMKMIEQVMNMKDTETLLIFNKIFVIIYM